MITARGGGLEELLGEYYAALAAGDPGRLPLAADVTLTENGQRIAIGTGLWATAAGVAGSRVVTVSEEAYGPGGTAGSVAGWGMITEGGADGADGCGRAARRPAEDDRQGHQRDRDPGGAPRAVRPDDVP